MTKAKVDLTWDETDLNRQEIVKSIHNGSVDEDNIRKYLACSSSSSSSSSEAEEEQTQEEKQKNEGNKNCPLFTFVLLFCKKGIKTINLFRYTRRIEQQTGIH